MASLRWILLAALAAVPIAPHPVKRSLYFPVDPVTILNTTSFGPTVLDKNTAWVVEYYMSWCGYCKRFAPIYKSFARDVYGWSKVVKVGVVECSDSFNTKLCQHYQIKSVPTTKFFPPYLQWTDMGEQESNTYNRTAVRYQLLDFLERRIATSHVPDFWPQLRRFSSAELGPYKSSLDGDTEFFVVLEPSEDDVYVGREVVMGSTSSSRKIKVVRMAYDPQEHASLVQSEELPALVRVENGGRMRVAERGNIQDPDESVKKLVQYLGGIIYDENVPPTPDVITPDEGDLEEVRHIPRDRVYLQDLEKALTYSLRQEIGLHTTLEGSVLGAFKNYTDILIKYFPARPPVKSMLEKIRTWISEQGNSVSIEAYQSFIESATTSDSYLPNHKKWKACRGSLSGYRGYPCGLWSTFHTLTVRAYNENDGKGDGSQVLISIRHFVENFFSCRYCSQNFVIETTGVEEYGKEKKRGLIFLWNIHNVVNSRLAGEMSEDPAFPKVPFPTADLCPKCNVTGKWDEEVVMQFLLKFYHIDLETSTQELLGSSSGCSLVPAFFLIPLAILLS